MYKRITKTLLFTLTFVATAVLAHPGDHEAMNPANQASHFMSDPWHVGIALAVAIIAIALGRRWLFGERQ